VVPDDNKEDGGININISVYAHLMELIQGRPSGPARIKWLNATKEHMIYNHY